MNNRLEPIPKHAFKPYHRKQKPYQQQEQQNRCNYEFELNIAEDNKALSHSSYDFMRMMSTQKLMQIQM
jgi:hypothetical protein